MKIEVMVTEDIATVKIDGKQIDDIITYFKVWMPEHGNIKYKCGINQPKSLKRKIKIKYHKTLYSLNVKINMVIKNIVKVYDNFINYKPTAVIK